MTSEHTSWVEDDDWVSLINEPLIKALNQVDEHMDSMREQMDEASAEIRAIYDEWKDLYPATIECDKRYTLLQSRLFDAAEGLKQ